MKVIFIFLFLYDLIISTIGISIINQSEELVVVKKKDALELFCETRDERDNFQSIYELQTNDQ